VRKIKALNGINPNRRFHLDLIADRRTGEGQMADLSPTRIQHTGSLLVSASPPITFIRFLAASAFSGSGHSYMADYISTWRLADTSKYYWAIDYHWVDYFH
jgi:hypothetical protein